MNFNHNPLILFGWGNRIRTYIHGFRVRCPTIERFPIMGLLKDLISFLKREAI